MKNFLLVFIFIIFFTNSCTVILKEDPHSFKTNQTEPEWIVIKSWDGKKNVDKIFLWQHAKKRGPKPFKVISPGLNVKIIKKESSAAYIMLPDGTKAWIDDAFIK